MRVRYSRFALDLATSNLRHVPGTDIANMDLECGMDIHSGLKGIHSGNSEFIFVLSRGYLSTR